MFYILTIKVEQHYEGFFRHIGYVFIRNLYNGYLVCHDHCTTN